MNVQLTRQHVGLFINLQHDETNYNGTVRIGQPLETLYPAATGGYSTNISAISAAGNSAYSLIIDLKTATPLLSTGPITATHLTGKSIDCQNINANNIVGVLIMSSSKDSTLFDIVSAASPYTSTSSMVIAPSGRLLISPWPYSTYSGISLSGNCVLSPTPTYQITTLYN